MDLRRIVSQVVVGVAVAVLASAAQADTIYVDDDNCPGPGSGTPGDPYCSIQMAIDNAVDTDEIVVSPGTYYETINFDGKAIWLHSSDGPEVTIIDAQQMGSVVTCFTGEGPTTVLEGFTITGGNAENGGGMFNDNCSPTATNCTFQGNTADHGGGMFNDSGSPTVTGCTFSDNQGGGMFNVLSSPTVTDCTFAGNTANLGGGMGNSYSSPTVTNCTFQGNTANDNGGGMYNGGSSPTVASCTFSGNAGVIGGGMANEDSSSPTVTESTFCGNVPDHWSGSLAVDGHTRMSDFCPVPACPNDSTGDGMVNVSDFLYLLSCWGACP